MTLVTVAIPTFNGEQRLPQVLECLLRQVNLEKIVWEVLVVDNNSTDATAKITRHYQQTWPSDSSLQYCFAAKQGAAFARQKAIEVAQGDIVAFLDDDNLPAENWVEQVAQFAIAHPQAGAFGSRIYGCFEVEPPQQIAEKIAPFLAIVNRGEEPHQYYANQRVLPPGAGLAVRKQAWVESVPANLFLNYLGQCANANTASEDLEVLIHIQKVGWQIWHNPAMVVYHQIAKERLQERNVLMLLRRIGLSRFHIRMLRYPLWQRPLLSVLHFLLDCAKLLVYYFSLPFDQQRSHFDHLCQREYLWSSLLSPFFLIRKYQLERKIAQKRQKNTPDHEFWLSKISTAFEKQLFCLFVQPIKSLDALNQEPCLVEVLLRLQVDGNGISTFCANDFMPTAVSFSLTQVIDRWVIEEVVRLISTQPVKWSGQHRQTEPLYFVNLSENSLKDEHFAKFLAKLLRYYPYLTHRICFEIPESVLLADINQSTQFIREIRGLGFAIAIDKVSHFSGLKKLLQHTPVDYLKVDVHQLEESYRDLILLQRYPTNEGFCPKLIAIQVENAALVEKVQDLGIDYAQGYAIGVPHSLKILDLVA
ncbi:hormogonium polysaccharide biosynthesis glycosyltransferase HpsE [Almyronema epifaneia]|uniref:Hormogonium polysaccharide biosynthesis glycosyltransferase HpsE n=1 Tax=Almyronema epifaneia S1 TaxID=2991925 RepID=A0ABW6IBY6_9CYAN